MKSEPHSRHLFSCLLACKVTLSRLSSLRVVQGLSEKLVRADQKGHVGARGLQGLKERRVTLD